jgi:hypothetical protein
VQTQHLAALHGLEVHARFNVSLKGYGHYLVSKANLMFGHPCNPSVLAHSQMIF